MSIIGPREGSGTESPITISAEIEKALRQAATAEEVKALMHRAALEQGLAEQNLDGALIPTALAANPTRTFSKTITVNGEQHTLEADSPEALAAAETSFWQEMFGQRENSTATEQARDPQTGRFVEQRTTDPNSKAIDAAVTDYLVRQGIDPDALRSVAAERANDAAYTQSWADATAEFLKDPKCDWPGGERNREMLGHIIAANGLEDQPSVENIRKAYQLMKENGLLENQKAERETAIDKAKSREELDRAIGYGSTRNHADWR